MAEARSLRPVMVALLVLAALVFASVPLAPTTRAVAAVSYVTVGKTPSGVAYDSAKGEVNAVVETVPAGTGLSNTTTSTTSSSSTSSKTSAAPTTASSSTTSVPPTTSSSGGGGIPEFPYQLLAATVFTLLVVASYLLVRRHSLQSGQTAKS